MAEYDNIFVLKVLDKMPALSVQFNTDEHVREGCFELARLVAHGIMRNTDFNTKLKDPEYAKIIDRSYGRTQSSIYYNPYVDSPADLRAYFWFWLCYLEEHKFRFGKWPPSFEFVDGFKARIEAMPKGGKAEPFPLYVEEKFKIDDNHRPWKLPPPRRSSRPNQLELGPRPSVVNSYRAYYKDYLANATGCLYTKRNTPPWSGIELPLRTGEDGAAHE